MPYEKRKAAYEILSKKHIPIIEDGFTEELQHHGGHIAPISAISGKGSRHTLSVHEGARLR